MLLPEGAKGPGAVAPSQPTTGIDDCCARAASGQADTAPPINLMNSRRFTVGPHLDTGADGKQFSARVQERTDGRCGSSTVFAAPKSNFCFTPESGLKSDISPCPVRAKRRHCTLGLI
jgi:hypothetical protein